MSLSNSRLAYEDCFKLLDAALEADRGIRAELADKDKAIYLRMRIHHARTIDRADNKRTYTDPDHPLHDRSPYDVLVCRIEGEAPAWLYLDKQKVEIGRVEEIPLDHAIEFKPIPQLEYRPEPERPMIEINPRSRIRRR